jgi:predicted metal-dependent enzyme (double-stranded beta helix superfamily)
MTTKNSLETFIAGVKSVWGPPTTEMVTRCRTLLAELTQTPITEEWLSELYVNPPDDELLYRDPEHDFLLLTYAEREGRYRVPHDHGAGWVLYAVQQGEMEMGTYGRVTDPNGKIRLVQRDVQRVRAGECMLYLPGDIHDTRCISTSALLFRFTSCDLKRESKEGRMTRYVQQDGVWIPGRT